MLAVAIGWQLYALSGRALDLGLVGLVQFGTQIALTLVVGQTADRYDRRAIVALCRVVSGAAAATLGVGTLGGSMTTGRILALVALIGAARAFEGPTMSALVASLVSCPLAPKAMAWSVSANQASRMVSPALGGVLYVLGAEVVYLVAATLFLIAGVLAALIRAPNARYPREQFTLESAAVIFGISTHLALSLLALAVLGASDVVSVVIRVSLVQLRTPDAMRGRVSAVHSLITGTANQLGEFESGLTAASSARSPPFSSAASAPSRSPPSGPICSPSCGGSGRSSAEPPHPCPSPRGGGEIRNR